MREVYRSGVVLVQGIPAGRIEETEEGYSFAYSEDYLMRDGALAVSLTLPLRKEPYYSKVLFPFFDGLIPEGWLLSIAQKTWKLDRRDRFGALLVTCIDCIGDVSVQKGYEL